MTFSAMGTKNFSVYLSTRSVKLNVCILTHDFCVTFNFRCIVFSLLSFSPSVTYVFVRMFPRATRNMIFPGGEIRIILNMAIGNELKKI